MLFGKEFRVRKVFKPIFKKIGRYEEFYAHIVNGKLEYEILDIVGCQPSPANWHNGEYAKMMRERASNILQGLLNSKYIELM